MLKAEIRNGSIVPLEPLPKNWNNGTKLSIEPVSEAPDPVDQIDGDFAELERICSQGSESDFEILQKALDEADREAKGWMRHEMGLPE